jgi:(p)ppGpp synthase/HD superfamily hydrolase
LLDSSKAHPEEPLPPDYGRPRFASAVAYAALIHAKQRRKGTTIPYVSHVMSVSALIMEFGGGEDQAIAGLFHDALEDCGAWHEGVIRANWGDRVADIVCACTDGVPDARGRKEAWRPRKERYLAHLRKVSDDVLLVSACDKLHNVRAIVADLRAGHDVFARFNKDAGRTGTLWYYAELERIFRERLEGTNPLYREFAVAVKDMAEQSPA